MSVVRYLSHTLQKLRIATAKWYYIHGIFCASHPYSIICIATAIVIFCCIPLAKLPLPGYGPLEHATPINEFVVPVDKHSVTGGNIAGTALPVDTTDSPEWLSSQSKPECFVQQIVVTAQVSPWRSDLIPIDIIRRPIGLAFDVLEEINNFTIVNELNMQYSLRDLCYQADQVLTAYRKYGFLTEDDCLVISPTNIWDSDIHKFRADSDILGTVFAHEKRTTIDSTPGFKDLAFGVQWSETGIKPQVLTSEKRTIRFAVTVVLREYNKAFMDDLTAHLFHRFGSFNGPRNGEYVVHIRFQNLPEIVQFLPLIVTYVVVLLYLCFSVSKLEMVKSKVGLAFSAVIAIIASLLMSAGLCSYFGLQTTLSGGEIFPYLVVIIGLENVIVITKSVVSTPVQLDVKYRIAQGLSREGWSINKNFLAELLILLLGYLTDVPAIREFCTFGLIGLLSDMFLQLVFFSAVLSIDIGRMELADHLSNRPTTQSTHDMSKDQVLLTTYPEVRCPVMAWLSPLQRPPTTTTLPPSPEVNTSPSPHRPVARRVRVLWYLGSRRVMQRALMALTLLWIIGLAYQSAYVLGTAWTVNRLVRSRSDVASSQYNTHKLSYRHWPTLFGYYNVSLVGKYISILPPIALSVLISPEEAVAHRHPLDHKKTPWKEEAFIGRYQQYFTAKMEQQDRWVVIVLVCSSTIAIVGLCLYAVRFSWPGKEGVGRESAERSVAKRPFEYDVRVSTLEGHLVGIRNIVMHEERVVSSCLAGQIRVWDWNEGKQMGLVKRSREYYKEVVVKNNKNGAVLRDFIFIEGTQISALAMNKSWLVAGCTDGLMEVYDSTTTDPLCSIHPPVQSALFAIALNDCHIFSGNQRGEINVFSGRENQDGGFSLKYSVKIHSSSIDKIVLFGEWIVSFAQDSVVKVLDVSDLTVQHSLWSSSGFVTACHVDKHSAVAVTGYDNGKVAVWNIPTGSLINDYTGQMSTAVKSVCVSDGLVVAAYVQKMDVQVWRWCRASTFCASSVQMRSDAVSELYIRDEFFFVGIVGEFRVYDGLSMVLARIVSLYENVPNVYLACPSHIVSSNGCDLICDYGRYLKVLKLCGVSKSR